MYKMSILYLNLVLYLIVSVFIRPHLFDDLPACQPNDFHYEYTECDAEGGRWRVSVPQPNTCVGGAPNPPVRGKGCDFTCEAGQYLDLQGDQVCHNCAAGTYSLGGGVRYDDWEKMPSDFSTSAEEFSYHSNYMDFDEGNEPNCSLAVWQARGSVVSSFPGNCSALLVYTANMVRPGYVTFTYQYSTSDVTFHFKVQNSQCQTVHEKETNRYLEATDEGVWRTVSAALPSGINVIYWRAMGVRSSNRVKIRTPVQIKSIEIRGVAYTSECSKCPAGTFSGEGASSCEECAENSYAEKGSRQCTACDIVSEYSERRSSACVKRPPCTVDDYFAYNSPCDRKNQTQILYKWVEPKICRDDVSDAVKLPSPGELENCPPCNPGMEFINGTCVYCPENYFSDGSDGCQPCPVSTAPEVQQVYKWWTNLPEDSNITAACISLNDRGCATRTGWVATANYIHSGKGHSDDAYLVISLDVNGFRGHEQTFGGKPQIVAEVSFTFELLCHKQCTFTFMEVSSVGGSTVVEQWTGETLHTKYTHKVYKTGPVTYSWAFQKLADDQGSAIPYHQSHSFLLREDVAKIFEIVVTNPLIGGAPSCRSCVKGSAESSGCIPCPPGHYMNETECVRCPAGTVVQAVNAWGVESCVGCGEGLVTNDNVRCYTPCKYTSTNGKDYDFSALAGVQTIDGVRLFSSYGSQYYQSYSISLCGDDIHYPLADCAENISLTLGKSNSSIPGYMRKDEVVKSPVCRVTMVPPRPGEGESGFKTAPMSIGDVLAKVTNNKTDVADIREKMKIEGFPISDEDLDVYFSYVTESTTTLCKDGRSTVIVLRCDMREEGNGTIEMSPKYPMGTSDGCNFHLLWRTSHACPVCKDSEFTVVKGECIAGLQQVHYIPPEYCILLSESKAYVQKQPCSVLPLWALIAIAVTLACGLLMCCMLIYCWKRNKKLEYKYMKLVQNSASKDGELPPVESCGLDEEDDEEPIDAHHNMVEVKDANRRQFFHKIRAITKKDDSFEDIHLSEKSPLT